MHRRTLALSAFASLVTLSGAAQASGAIVAVEVSVPGRPAEWVEEHVARPLERSLSKLPGLASMKSASSESRYLLELRYEVAPDARTIEEVRSVALAAWRTLEVSVAEPMVAIRVAKLA